MSNIWEFLLQTATVSLAAALLLLLKKLFEDKLPPRWQYTVWFLLALRILLPAATRNRYILLPLPVWIETLKAATEQNLSSLFSAPFDPVHLASGLPWPALSVQSAYHLSGGMPQPASLLANLSITDWLFLVYIAGVLVGMARYIVSYIRLRRLLTGSTHLAPPEIQAHVYEVASRYNLRACRIVMVEGLPTAFVCGIFKPLLALPCTVNADGTVQSELPDTLKSTSEKILLHELLHLKHRDAVQSVFWSLLRALHWCNPFLQYVFDRIGNDMEALCDQRVLERLEGEERREYGEILLGMTNERYPRAFGTTSLSNGAANIARRIGCIARFKKYPAGMGLVSVCIALMLAGPLFVGTVTHTINDRVNIPEKLHTSLAASRLNRCTTVSGAIDTYVKGLLNENGLYIAASSPLNQQDELLTAMIKENAHTGSSANYTLPNDLNAWPDTGNTIYSVFNLRSAVSTYGNETVSYDAELIIALDDITQGQKELEAFYLKCTEEELREMAEYAEDNNTTSFPGCAIYYLTVFQEGSSWVVSERKPHDKFFDDIGTDGLFSFEEFYDHLPDDSYGIYSAAGKAGTIRLQFCTYYTVDNTATSNNMFWGNSTYFDNTAKLNAQFYSAMNDEYVEFRYSGSDEERKKITQAGMYLIPLDTADVDPSTLKFKKLPSFLDTNSSSSDGTSYISRTFEPGEWDGVLKTGSGRGFSGHDDPFDILFSDGEPKTSAGNPPAAYAAQITLNGRVVDELILTPKGGAS